MRWLQLDRKVHAELTLSGHKPPTRYATQLQIELDYDFKTRNEEEHSHATKPNQSNFSALQVHKKS